jgi:hypothetical protein
MPSGGGGGGDQDGRWRHAGGRRPECVEGPDAVTSGEWVPGGQILHKKTSRIKLFFLEHAGELRINILRRKGGKRTPNRQYNTHINTDTHTHKHTHTHLNTHTEPHLEQGRDRASVS